LLKKLEIIGGKSDESGDLDGIFYTASKDTGLPRESLYKTLSGASKPRFDTIAKISSALGLNIAFVPRTL
ncbi:hypothetical protein Q7Z35_00765, partial [Glaesserella parasuis]|nr:hypothetical protein [Glaesserella parasuis]